MKRLFQGHYCNAQADRWFGDVLRHFNQMFPGAVSEWRSLELWEKLLERYSAPAGWRPSWIRYDLVYFLNANDNVPGTDNPWSIERRIVEKRCPANRRHDAYSYMKSEYRITRVRTSEEQSAHSRERSAKQAAQMEEVRLASGPYIEDLDVL